MDFSNIELPLGNGQIKVNQRVARKDRLNETGESRRKRREQQELWTMISDCLRVRSKTNPELAQILQSYIAGYSAAGSIASIKGKKGMSQIDIRVSIVQPLSSTEKLRI
jgi:hypothetical protein